MTIEELENLRTQIESRAKMIRAFIEFGGPDRQISVNGEIVTFEMHPYFGPFALNKRGDVLLRQPLAFLQAVTLWQKQGSRIENGLCIWDHEPEPILKHLGGRNYQILGYHPAVRGS